jgi:hypothetical protein
MNRTKERSIEKMVDLLLEMEPTTWVFEDFMKNIVGWKAVPKKGRRGKQTYAYMLYTNRRSFYVYKINDELARRADCRRLKIVTQRIQTNGDVRLEGFVEWMSKEISPYDVQVRQFKRQQETDEKTILRCNEHIAARNISAPQVKMLTAIKRDKEEGMVKRAKRFADNLTRNNLPSGYKGFSVLQEKIEKGKKSLCKLESRIARLKKVAKGE